MSNKPANPDQPPEDPQHDLSYTTTYLLKILSGSTEALEAPDKRRANGTYLYLSMLYEAAPKGQAAIHRVWERIQESRPELARLIGTSPVSVTENLPQAELAFISDCLLAEELGDAQLLAHLYASRICYDYTEKQWYRWAGHHWQADKTCQMRGIVAGQLVAQYRVAAGELDKQIAGATDALLKQQLESQRDRLLKRCTVLCTLKRIKNVLELAEMLLPLTGEWDSRPWLLGVQNGVLDLKTGQLLMGHPGDYLRKVAPTVWEGLETPAPRFEQFMAEIMDDNQAMVDFLQRLLGYGITGLTSEHILAIFYGEEGRNGKDTLLETIGTVLGDMAGTGTNDLLIEGKSNPGQASPHLYSLMGQRLVWVSETRESAQLNTNQVKEITGGGRISCRPLYGNQLQFQPSHLLILQTNHKPRIPSGGDPALWERMLLILFKMRFVEKPSQAHERARDPYLREKLCAEQAGILAWLVRGCLAYQAQGLQAPATVQAATEAYQVAEDTMQQFIAECCVVGVSYTASASGLYEAFQAWGGTLGKRKFGERLSKSFSKQRVPGKGSLVYQGLGLLDTSHQEPLL